MAAANGFTATAPDARYGDAASALTYAWAKFTCGGSGTQEVTKIGAWAYSSPAGRLALMGIWTHDAVNDCPEALVANSTTAELTLPATEPAEISHTYSGTKPQLTGGQTYWIGWIGNFSTIYYSNFASGGAAMTKTGITYPTFPAADEFHTHTNSAKDIGAYAVYQAAGEPPTFQAAWARGSNVVL